MQAYLAAKYMTGPKADAILARTTAATTKKKKRKTKNTDVDMTPSFIKDDDDELRWGKPIDEEPEENQAVIEKDRSFKKRKVEQTTEDGAGWITVRDKDPNAVAEDDIPVEDVSPAPALGGLVMPSEFKSSIPQKKSKKGKERDDGAAEAQETVYRDATGRKIKVESAEEVAARKKDEEREEVMKEAQKKEWQKGLVQREAADARRREEEKLRSRGVAR